MKTPAFRIVIVYEDFACGLRAKETSERLTVHLKPHFEFVNCDVWKFELLGHPQLRHQAAADASEADMIIVSAKAATEPPTYVKEWVEDWLHEKRTSQTALVALLEERDGLDDSEEDRDASPAAPVLHSFLKETAQRGRMDFFCKTDWGQHDCASLTSNWARARSPVQRVEVSHWGRRGINE